MKLFISHSRADLKQVQILVDILHEGAYDPWFDQKLLVGQDWKEKLAQAIDQCDAFVYALSLDSVDSEWCQWEFARAVRAGKPIIPVRVSDNLTLNSLPAALKGKHIAEFTESNSVNVARLMGGLTNLFIMLSSDDVSDIPEYPQGRPARVESTTVTDRIHSVDVTADESRQPNEFIYIAYSSNSLENGFVPQLLNQLNAQNYAPWVDFQNYAPRSDWQAEATPAIEQASMMIVVVTPRSMRSENVMWEVYQAQRANVPIIPVIVESAPLNNLLRGYPPVDLVNRGRLVETSITLSGVVGEIAINDRRWKNGDVIPIRFEYDFERLVHRLESMDVTNLHGAFNDRVADEDQLEFKHYVYALSDLITSPETAPPITIGIFGSWGAGKSFLLDHIKRKVTKTAPYGEADSVGDKTRIPRWQSKDYFILFRPFVKFGNILDTSVSIIVLTLVNLFKWLGKRIQSFYYSTRHVLFDVANPNNADKDDNVGIEIVDFNAWEYSATDIVWPGLVRKIMTLLEKEVSIPTRIRVRLTRNLKQQLSKLQLWLLLFVSAIVGIVVFNVLTDSVISQGITIIGVIGLSASLIKILTDLFAHPMAKWLTTLFEREDYGKQIGYMEEIRHDLELLERGLQRKNKRVLIIVDDLDRCEPEKAVEMLQAVKLLLNFDSFIVILGIDARIITRAIERHYSDLLGPAGASGYEYLDKIIQIPFRIPRPIEAEIRSFIDKQMSGGSEEADLAQILVPQEINQPLPEQSVTYSAEQETQNVASNNISRPQTEPTTNTNGGDVARQEVIRQSRALAFTSEERAIFKQLAMLIKPNPRHIKRLINVYRLIKTLAEYRQEPFINSNRRKTIHWVVLCGQWPYTVHAMLQIHKELLEDEFEDMQAGKKSECFPEVDNVLVHLHDIAKKQLDHSIRARLDYDPDQFFWLVSECKLNWDELAKLRMYTVNFNPAVESETRQVFHVQNQQTQMWVE